MGITTPTLEEEPDMVRMLEVLLVAYVFAALFAPPLLEARRDARRQMSRVRARR